jgi:hypothetical protein
VEILVEALLVQLYSVARAREQESKSQSMKHAKAKPLGRPSAASTFPVGKHMQRWATPPP